MNDRLVCMMALSASSASVSNARRPPQDRPAAADRAVRRDGDLRGAGGGVLVLPGRPARRSSEEMAENNHQRTLALRAPRGVLFDRNGRVLVENRDSFNISIVREHTKDLDRTIRLLAARGAASTRRRLREIVRPAPPRAELPADPVIVQDATLAQVAAVTRAGSTSSCPTSSSSRCRRGATRPTRWRRTCSATSARSARRRSPRATACRAATSSGRRASRRSTTRC